MSYRKDSCCDCCEFDNKCDYEPECEDFEPKCHKPKLPRKVTALQAVSLVPQTVAAGAAVPFDTNLVTLGCGIIHTPGGTDFNLIQPGIYRVTFTGTVTPVGTTAGVALALNGSILPGTTVTETVIAGESAALATQALIQVPPFMSSVVTVVNPTAGIETFTNPNIIIERIA